MDVTVILELLLLLCIANGVPVVATKIMGGRWGLPVDLGLRWWDGRPIFGASKTWRGLVSATVITGICGVLLNLGFIPAAQFALAAMAGDLLSSFIKRRLGLAPSSMALGLDQIPESLFPVLLVYSRYSLSAIDLAVIVGVFFVAELVLSRLAYALHLRDRPY